MNDIKIAFTLRSVASAVELVINACMLSKKGFMMFISLFIADWNYIQPLSLITATYLNLNIILFVFVFYPAIQIS